MSDIVFGGGGGVSPNFSTDDQLSLSKMYDITGQPTAEKMAQIDEMLHYLYKHLDRIATSSGMTGPSSSTVGDVPYFTTTTGRVLGDSGKLYTNLVTGPASAVAGDVAQLDATGKILSDGGKLVSDLVTGPASAASGGIAQFNGTTGKIIQDGGSFATILAGVGWVIGTLKLNTAQLDALNGTPITIIPAQGATKTICVVSLHAVTTRSGAWSASPTYRAQYNGSATTLLAGAPGSLLAGAGAGTTTAMSPAANGTTIASGFANTAVEVTFSADTNPGAQTATAWLACTASIIDAT